MKTDFNSIARRLDVYTKHYMINKRRSYSISYPHKEFECKIKFTSHTLDKIIRSILASIKEKSIEIDEIVRRQEFHHFYGNKKTHRAFIFLQGSKEVWIKEKSKNRVVHTHKFNVPILVRKEEKLRPKDLIYSRYFLDTLKWNYVGSFNKKCIDISFWFNSFLYTITIAESHTGWRKLSQIEIEYDGHAIRTKKPSEKRVLSLFDEIIPIIIPKPARYFTTETKLEWLQSR